MTEIPAHFQLKVQPVANPQAVVTSGQARFTLLTSRLLRMEFAPLESGQTQPIFEERPSQVFWQRLQPVPEYQVQREEGWLEISTEFLRLRYQEGKPFTPETLFIDMLASGATWHYGDANPGNLGGTVRTLDRTSGPVPLEPGLVSRLGWVLVDDSLSLVFNEQGWLEPRRTLPGTLDLYFFGYGQAYETCLADFCRVSGPVPVIPRWSLGNWWSRFWEYSQEELQDLMLDFRHHQTPLSVCIIDMDWHLQGWTGYTWNDQLFSDPPALLRFLHGLGLKVALNLHPASGIGPHEAAYARMVEAVGKLPASGSPVAFDLENPVFAKAYFEILHHPQEAQGIDFWWMDWQQGNPTQLPGLNLLWWINHLHFLDLGREERKRPFIFSRWGGLGNQRYPIGFSGDTVVSWDSLAFQPYFTATAANVNYGWWSHDIGGHMDGIEDPELYTRWVQLGLFSPILRLHSTKNPFHERRPWAYDAEVFRVTQHALQLRHALIPYLYSMAWRNHHEGIPLVRPMYHLHPQAEEAYACPNQYAFGSELVVAPFISPHDPDTLLSRQVAWLPPGDWYGFFDGRFYAGGSWQALYGGLEEIPVFAKAGAIVPLGPLADWDATGTPVELSLVIFPGANNRFELYEDDGDSAAYLRGDYALTTFVSEWQGNELVLSIQPSERNRQLTPPQRSYTLIFRGFIQPDRVEVQRGKTWMPALASYDEQSASLTISDLRLVAGETLAIRLQTGEATLARREGLGPQDVFRLLSSFRLSTEAKKSIFNRWAELQANPGLLAAYLSVLAEPQVRALVELLAGAGWEHVTNTGEELLVLWNNQADADFTYQISRVQGRVGVEQHFTVEDAPVPRFRVFRPAQDFTSPTLLQLRYRDVLEWSYWSK